MYNKTCTKCQIEKPTIEFGKENRNKDKLSTRCKKCLSNQTNTWRKNNPEKQRIRQDKQNASPRTKIQKKEYWEKQKNNPDKPTRPCPICGDIITYINNSQLNDAIRKNKKCAANCFGKAGDGNKICCKCRIEKPLSDFGIKINGDIKPDCKICYKTKIDKWRKANPERIKLKSREYSRKRRASKSGVKENYTEFDEQITVSIFGHNCFKCGSTDNIEIDHHLPLDMGNPLTVKNAVPLCTSCNRSKSTKDPTTFYTKDELDIISDLFKRAAEIKNQPPK